MKKYSDIEKINAYNNIIGSRNTIRDCEHKCNEILRFAIDCNKNSISRSGFTEMCESYMQEVIRTLVSIEP